MGEAIAFAAPRAEEMTRTISNLAGAGIAGLAEGLIVRIAPQMGAAAPVLTWGALIGTPMLGTLGALFTRGMLGNVFQGVAAGGVGVLAYSLPEMIAPVGRRGRTPTPGQGQLGAGSQVKLLPGAAGAAQRAQQAAAVRSSVEF